MQHLIDKASILHEALPYIRRFHGRVMVVKYGGHAMVDTALRDSFARDVVLLKFVGLNPVVVHGGGPQIDETLASLGVTSERVDGIRVTDDKTMHVVEMVLRGHVNPSIVSLIGAHGGQAVGITGQDNSFMRAQRIGKMKTPGGQSVDPGRVGKITEVKTDLLRQLISGGFIPVIAPVAVDEHGGALNVNADTAAGAVASALQAEKLVIMTDTEGVKGDGGKLLRSLSAREAKELRERGVIDGGMIPKVQCALDALKAGVHKSHIIDGRVLHAMLLEIFTDEGVGTEIMIKSKVEA